MTTSSMSTTTVPDRTPVGGGDEGSTADQAKHVAGVAGQEAKQVASDVKEQARGLLEETRTQVQDQSRTQRDRLVDTLRSVSDDLDQMAQERSGLASDAVREVSHRARAFSQRLDGREPSELLEDLRSFARRRPGVFLAGAVISGVVAGRILRGTRDAAHSDTTTDVAAQDQERPPTAYEPTTTSVSPPALADETLAAPGTGTATYPVDPAVTTPTAPTQTGSQVGGP